MLKRLRDSQLAATAIARWRALRGPFHERKRAVYVVQYGELYKIGLSVNPMERIKHFMLPEVVATIRVYWVPKAVELERALHRKYAAQRQHGEWFKLPETALNEMDGFAERWKQAAGVS